jgi:hypothetical protein
VVHHNQGFLKYKEPPSWVPGSSYFLDHGTSSGAPFGYRRHWMKAQRLNLAVTDGLEKLNVRSER